MRLATLAPPDVSIYIRFCTRAPLIDSQDDDADDFLVFKDHEMRDHRWQIMALLGERSTVRENLRGSR
jgi:hypothetical protein